MRSKSHTSKKRNIERYRKWHLFSFDISRAIPSDMHYVAFFEDSQNYSKFHHNPHDTNRPKKRAVGQSRLRGAFVMVLAVNKEATNGSRPRVEVLVVTPAPGGFHGHGGTPEWLL